MTIFKFLPLFLGIAASLSQAAPANPKLAETTLYKVTARQCETADLKVWKHRTLDVLTASEVTAAVKWVQLCNDKKYPIFGIEAKLDRNSSRTNAQFGRLYADLQKANGGWPLAVVLTTDGWIDAVDKAGRIESETYSD